MKLGGKHANGRGKAVDRTVADLNIAHFTKLLEAEADPLKRQTIERLFAEEEAKLARALADNAGTRKNPSRFAMDANASGGRRCARDWRP